MRCAHGEVSIDRVNSRNGYRARDFDTRVGSIDLAIPKLRSGSYFPDWLLEPRRRAERALTQVVAECYVREVSTRRVEGLVKTLGIEHLSKSQVSRMAKDLDIEVEAFRARPLDQGMSCNCWHGATDSSRPIAALAGGPDFSVTNRATWQLRRGLGSQVLSWTQGIYCLPGGSPLTESRGRASREVSKRRPR